MANKMYAALGKNVFVQEITKEVVIGGMIIPDSISSDFTFGEVISCSEGYFEHGTFVPANVRVGDKVAFPKIAGTHINLDGNKLIKVSMSDIVAKEIEATILEEVEGE